MKKKLYRQVIRLFSLLLIATSFLACDAHRDFPDTAMKPGHILCTDGKVLSITDFEQSGKQPIAVYFISITMRIPRETAMLSICGTWSHWLLPTA